MTIVHEYRSIHQSHHHGGKRWKSWPEDMIKQLLPRIYQILVELNRRLCAKLWNYFPGRVGAHWFAWRLSPTTRCIWPTCAWPCPSRVNGVTQLHGEILKEAHLPRLMRRSCPKKFSAITNGITHRRWLMGCNPKLTDLICQAIGDKWIHES